MKTPIVYKCQKIKDKLNRDRSHHMEFIAIASGKTYVSFERSAMLRGPHKGSIKFKMTSVDYTCEHPSRKTVYKFYSSSKSLGHISKVYLNECGKASGDIKGTNDLLLFHFEYDQEGKVTKLTIYVYPSMKNSYPIISQFLNG